MFYAGTQEGSFSELVVACVALTGSEERAHKSAAHEICCIGHNLKVLSLDLEVGDETCVELTGSEEMVPLSRNMLH